MPQSRRAFLRQGLLTAGAAAFVPTDVLVFGHQPGTLESGANERVLVLGAGLAGLAAAYELNQAGHEVEVLEARTRPGGRIRTLRSPFAGGLRAEGSAARIPKSHDLVFKYADLVGLEMKPFKPDKPTDLIYFDDQVLQEGQPDLLKQAGLPPEEQKLGTEGIMKKYLAPLLKKVGDPSAENWPSESLLRYDRVTGFEMFREAGLSKVANQFFNAGWGVADDVSGLRVLHEIAGHSGRRRRIVGGTDRLPRGLASTISGHIRYGQPVTRIEQADGAVTAVCEKAGSTEHYTADQMICTIPFSVLRDIEIDAGLSEGKQNAIEGLPYQSVTRVFVQTSKRFWEKKGLSGFAQTDHPMEIWDASYGQPGRRGILMAYFRSDLARKVAPMPEEKQIRFALDAIAEVFPGVKDHYEGAVTLSWDEDPWTQGAFATYHPGDYRRFYRHLTRPEGRVHFAGEHTSPWPGWMHGALHSGIRAAKEVSSRE